MANEQKINEITQKLRDFVAKTGSANKAKNFLGISVATVSNILAGKIENISDAMWSKIEKQLDGNKKNWVIAETRFTKVLNMLYSDAQRNALVYTICGNEGGGKDCSAKQYALNNSDVWVVNCASHWNKKRFLFEILKSMGKDAAGMNLFEMLDMIIESALKAETPLLILNEFDKIDDHILNFFIILYNELEGMCGFVIQATDFLKLRIEKGLHKNKKGYKEIYSRFGRKFVMIEKASKTDIAAVCKANGISDELFITEVYNSCEGDLRRARTMILAERGEETAA